MLFGASLVDAIAVYTSAFGVILAWSAPAAARAFAVDASLLTLFALHHSIFARTRIKTWIAARVPPPLERSIYVWCASLLFLATLWAWQPVPGVGWRVTGLAALPLRTAQLAGLTLTLHASWQLGVFELAGLRAEPAARLRDEGLYRLVRHPIYLGWVLMVWPTPLMTGSRLAFAALTTAYLVIAVPFEERALRRHFGLRYESYARRVKWRIVWGVF